MDQIANLWVRAIERAGTADALGTTDGHGGAVAFSPLATQSLDRATAWARAVTSVLRLNNVVAKVETYPD
jgi:hypothetical protein